MVIYLLNYLWEPDFKVWRNIIIKNAAPVAKLAIYDRLGAILLFSRLGNSKRREKNALPF